MYLSDALLFFTNCLKNLFAPLCGLCGLNLTAESAKKRKEILAVELLLGISEMASKE